MRRTLLKKMAGSEAVMKTFLKGLLPPAQNSTPYEYNFCIDKPSTATVKIKNYRSAPVINISKNRSWISLSVHEFESLVENADEFREKIEECKNSMDPNITEEMKYSVITSSSKKKAKSEVEVAKKKRKRPKVAETTVLSEVSDVEENE